jgi:hypothetical protein
MTGETPTGMTAEQVSTLNALVTFAVEQLDAMAPPGRVRSAVADDEREVARIVGQWALKGCTLVAGVPV